MEPVQKEMAALRLSTARPSNPLARPLPPTPQSIPQPMNQSTSPSKHSRSVPPVPSQQQQQQQQQYSNSNSSSLELPPDSPPGTPLAPSDLPPRIHSLNRDGSNGENSPPSNTQISQTQKLSMKFQSSSICVNTASSGLSALYQQQQSQNATSSSATATRFSVSSALLSLSSSHDQDGMVIDDELSLAQQRLKELKSRISSQSKRNFLLERDVRYLDSRIALLIQNRMALDEVRVVLADDEKMAADGGGVDGGGAGAFLEEKKKRYYSHLFFLLQTDPRLVAHLCRLVKLGEIDTLLQTVMFTLYGNQYDTREEHLLLTMFQSVLHYEFESASEFGSLLRANTPVSRMMTTYTRRGPGQQYLKLVLSENINSLLSDQELNLEIDPAKVYEQMINQLETDTGMTCPLPRGVTAEEAAKNEDVIAILQPRIAKLIAIANRFLDTTIESLPQVPYGIRWICKQIRQLTRRKFPEASPWSICSLIGGFFFLRFLNPAIVTPQSYMIVDTQPAKNVRRTLTLVAKLLQNLANKPTHNKEAYMMQLGSFVDDNKERITNFLNDLCNVEDFYEVLEMDQYLAIAKKDLSLNISLNELYNTHALLMEHISSIFPLDSDNASSSQLSYQRAINTPEQSYRVSCGHLRALLNDLGQAPPQLPRKDNKTIQLALFPRWETAPILFAAHMVDLINSKETATAARRSSLSQQPLMQPHQQQQLLSDAEVLYLDTKSLIIQIMRKQFMLASELADSIYNNHLYVPIVTISNIPTYSDDAVPVDEILDKAAHQTKDSALAKRSLRARQNLRILEDRYHHSQVNRSTGYQALGLDIYQDFRYLSELTEKLKDEIWSLEIVYKTICEHNKYLRSQLESYKAYLQNVRIQASGGGGMLGARDGAGIINSASHSTTSTSKSNNKKSNGVLGPFKFTHSQLEKDGVILESGVPENRRNNVFFSIKAPIPGSFVIGLHYKGREKPIVEVDLKLDDLLEKQQENVQRLDLEYVQLNVNKTLHLLNKHFLKRY